MQDGQGTHTGQWGTRLGPTRTADEADGSPEIASEPSDAEDHVGHPPADAEPLTGQPEAQADPSASTPDTPAGLLVWQVPDGVAHWGSSCPQRAGQTACSGTQLHDTLAAPVPAHTVPADRRCTSSACAARWRRWTTGQPLRFRCDRCRATHEHEESR